ncbi:hypothetical protein AALP_AA6G066400 [Arabis alpina]|uniref:Leucine-rich repeat-containing N-terminal plant-type domain-containing protein n=1 Tax=Arabis alpina TaxID=50452 RepID=A0A087GMI6_ARAAL|nr:hypothetical protein AALP_AA6G066400 [Arabis alpina]
MISAHDCRPDQIRALTQFKDEFDSHGCNHSDYFDGVQCDNATGVVTVLQLPTGCLIGTLKPNSSLFGLHHLRHLNLSHNNFTLSSLPPRFGNLNRLELDLSHNELVGSFQLVQNLTKLSILDLSYNQFSGTIPSSLFMMPYLSSLNLSGNHLTGPIEVHNSTSSRLEHLRLRQNPFEGQILEPISKLINLKELDLSYLNISYPTDFRLFSSLKALLSLRFSGNRLSPASLSTDSDIPLSLEILFVSGCDINQFPNFLKSLHNLELINMDNNKIKGKVPEWLWKLPRLSRVSLINNAFTYLEGSADVLVNSSVKILDLALNQFKGPFPNPPLSISVLSAWNNSFTGNIPLSICNRSSLTILDLSYNNFTGPIPPCPSNFQSSLIIVNLRKNNLVGSLPDIFYAGASLRTLDIGYNQLTGKLPRSFLNCSSLKFVSLDHNRIKDTFPFWLKALPDLQALTLRSNKFYGPISPPDQGPLAFPELRILEISDNNFAGSLPPNYFVKWKASFQMGEDGRIYMGDYHNPYYIYEDTIDLQYKGLFMEQGKVLTSYSTIDFSGNRIEGQIPESIGLLKALIALNLSNNAFTGHIPLSLANLTELESLDLSKNQLSGTIPKELGGLSFLAYISVSHNQLKGEIPQGTQITGQPKSSFEGNARLCGLPLEESCFGSTTPPTQQPKEEEDEDQVLNWKAVIIGYGPGLLFGLVLAHVIASYNLKWFVKIVGPDKRKEEDPVKMFMSLDSRWDSFNNMHSIEQESDMKIYARACRPDQIQALMQFKDEFDSHGCNHNDYRDGVRCDNATGVVTVLKLPSGCLLGNLKPNSSLFGLHHLRYLDLSHNNFTSSSISPGFGNLNRLEILDLALNHFKGPFPTPPLSIHLLSAWNNSFTGNIPLATCNRSSLTILDLSYNNFTGPIPQCLSNFQNSLIVVNLRKNNLEGSLPDLFYAGALLQTLDVGYNQLTGKLPRSLLNCSSLRFVSLDHNRIKDTFPLWLKALPDLQALTLRSNKFYGPISPPDQGPLAFPELRILEISDNKFTGSLPPDYFVNWKASSFQTVEDGRIYMGDYNNPYYIYEDTIDLQYKGLFMEQGKILTSYSTIDFSGNRIEGQIPESIGLLKELIALNLSNNAFTGNIPLSLANLTELESLDLSKNQLSGQPKSSFEGNARLCGLPLDESCYRTNAPPTQRQNQEDDEEEVLNWKAAAIGYGPGVLFGLVIGHVLALYKPEWLGKLFGPNKLRNH